MIMETMFLSELEGLGCIQCIYVCIYVKSDVRFALNINQSINQSTKTLCHMSLATCNIKQIYMKDFFVKKIKQGGWPRPSYENKKGYLDMACLYKTIYWFRGSGFVFDREWLIDWLLLNTQRAVFIKDNISLRKNEIKIKMVDNNMSRTPLTLLAEYSSSITEKFLINKYTVHTHTCTYIHFLT